MSRHLFVTTEDLRTGELFNAVSVKCRECGSRYIPVSVLQRDQERCPEFMPGSHAAFLEPGTLTQTEMWALAEQQFPKVAARLRRGPTATEEPR